jgi:drug/metabolite transporter (DMT)-like permease
MTAAVTPRQRPLYGIGLMILGMSFFPASDGLSKYLTGFYEPAQIMWLRNLIQICMVLPFVLRPSGRKLMRSYQPRLQLIRGVLTIIATLAFITSLHHIPLADGVAILFAGGIFLVVVSALLLGETVGRVRWIAVAVGFAGVLIIIRPGLGVVHWAASLALAAALGNAFMQAQSRQLGRTDSAVTTFFWTSIVGATLLAPIATFVWTPIAWESVPLLIGAGVCGGLGHFLLVRAFEFAPASVLAPFNYAQIVMAVVIGYFAFSDIPDRWTVIGLFVIVGTGFFLLHYERRAHA